MAREQPLQFIIANANDFEPTQTRSPGPTVSPSEKRKRWEPIMKKLLAEKLPQTEQDWDRILCTQDDVERTLQKLVLSHLSPARKAALTWKDLFSECAEHFKRLAGEKADENLIELFKLAVIGLSEVAIKEGVARDEIYEYLRNCLWHYSRSGQQLGDETLRKSVKATREGIQFVERFANILGPRSNELPLYVASWTTVFLSYTAECGQYIEEHKSSVYRPKRQLQSGCLSVINLVYLLLGGKYCGRDPQKIRDIFLSDQMLACQSRLGVNLTTSSSLQACDRFSSAPRQRASTRLYALGYRTIELQQVAISDIMTDILITRPTQRAQGLYSYGLPQASVEYFEAAIREKAVKLNTLASMQGATLENLLTLPAEAFRSEVGTATWPALGGALLLPLTNKTVDVKLLDRCTGTARRSVWHSNQVMYLEHEGLAAINGSIHYIYAPIDLSG